LYNVNSQYANNKLLLESQKVSKKNLLFLVKIRSTRQRNRKTKIFEHSNKKWQWIINQWIRVIEITNSKERWVTGSAYTWKYNIIKSVKISRW
jgi:hypothetical protein